MDSNERRRRLAKILDSTSENLPLTVQKIASLLQVSIRTVHYDLDLLESELIKKGQHLKRRARVGVWLEQGATEKNKLVETRIYSKQERQDRIILALLNGKCQIDELADMLFISRTTLLEDLREVKELIESRGLIYNSKRGLGIWLHGTEQVVRDMLIHIFSRAAYDFRRFNAEAAAKIFEQELFCKFSQDLPVAEIARYFLRLMREREILENDMSTNRMICALVVALKRISIGKTMPLDKEFSELKQEVAATEGFAREIAGGLSFLHEGFLASGEIYYIVRELLHSRIFLFTPNDTEKNTNIEAVDLARRFIGYAQSRLGEFYLDDDELIYQLALHLQPAIERAHFGIKLTNPLLGSIKEQYPSLYLVAKEAAETIEKTQGIAFSEDEIGYLTVHLGGAVERRNMKREKSITALLICGSGIGTANLLAMTLRNNLPYIKINKIVSLYKLTENDIDSVDIIISTVDIETKEKAVLRVSPILTDAGIRVIEGQIRYFYNKKYLPEYNNCPKIESELSLLDVLAEDSIELNYLAKDWQDAVRCAGNLLMARNAVTANYVDKMVEMVRTIGPYIVVCDGVALPHAHIEDGAKNIAVSFVRLKNPIRFDSQDLAPVDMIFAFSAIDEKSHYKMLADLWQIFNSPTALSKIRALSTPKRILKYIADFLKANPRQN